MSSKNDLEGALRSLQPATNRLFGYQLARLLMTHPFRWRQRRSQTITPLDARHYRERLSLQFAVPSKLVGQAFRMTAASSPDLSWGDRRSLRELSHSDWRGESSYLPVPLFTLKKEVLLRPDVEDASGKRVTLQNRFLNSEYTVFYVVNNLYTAQEAVDYGLEDLDVLLQTIFFAIPRGIIATHFSDEVKGNLRGTDTNAHSDTMERFLIQQGFVVGDLRPQVEEIVHLGSRLAKNLLGANLLHGEDPFRDPVVNPLLVAGDFKKLFNWGGTFSEPLPEGVTLQLLESARRFFLMMEDLLTRKDHRLAQATMRDIQRFAHRWVAISQLEVRLDAPQLVKLSSTVPVDRGSRGPRTIDYEFPAVLGDAQATHIEILSPDPEMVRFRPGAAIVALGSELAPRQVAPREIFGFDYSESDGLRAFYTTKPRSEVAALVSRLEAGSEAPGGPDSVRLRVGLQLHTHILVFYILAVIVGLATVLVAGIGFPESLKGSNAAIPAVIAIATGLVATRERLLAAQLLIFFRWALGVFFVLIFVGLVFANLEVGSLWTEDDDQKNERESDTERIDRKNSSPKPRSSLENSRQSP